MLDGPDVRDDNEWIRRKMPPECSLVIRVLMDGEEVLDPLLGIKNPKGEIAWVNVWGSATDWRETLEYEPTVTSS